MNVLGGRDSTEKLHWTLSMSVDVDKLDYQHRELFCLVNDLIDLIGENKDSESFVVAFKFLENYVVGHFGEEERYMELFDYPGIREHKDQHAIFKKTLLNMKERYEEFGATEPFLNILQSQLVVWVFTHVSNIDGMLGEYLKGKTRDNA